jgi:hypothetical protein
VLRERCALTMAYAAVRRGSSEAVATRVIEHFRARIAASGDASGKASEDGGVAREKARAWRYELFRLLLALGRDDALLAELRDWMRPDDASSLWRRALGYLLAETGALAEAVEVFAGVRQADGLQPVDYENLAAWHLVLGNDAERKRALRRRWEVSSVHELSSHAHRIRQTVHRPGGSLPGSIAPQDVEALELLLAKATHPSHFLWVVGQIYRAGKDHRVLGSLPYGVLGHSQGAVYDFLSSVAGIVQQIHEEATCDSLVASIGALKDRARGATDRRGLLLLLSLVERRAAQVKNAPGGQGGHVEAALRAMQAAFSEKWQDGERRQMAQFLAALGRIEHATLAAEQLRQLRELHAASDEPRSDRLQIGVLFAQTLWSHGKKDEAVTVLGAALGSFRPDAGQPLGTAANSAVSVFLGYLRSLGRFAAGEDFLQRELGLQRLATQEAFYTQSLYGLYVACVEAGGTVAAGSGAALYDALRRELEAAVRRASFDLFQPLLQHYSGLFRAAKEAGIDGVAADLMAFARDSAPELLGRFVTEQGRGHGQIAQTIDAVAGPVQALGFLVTALESEPGWLEAIQRGYWRSVAGQVARFRHESTVPAPLEERLWAVAHRELQADLERRSWRHTALFFRNQKYFWHERAADLASETSAFLASHRTDPGAVAFAAGYLWSGLHERESAITALEALDGQDLLREGLRWQLAGWLQETRQWGRMLPHLTRLVELREDRLDYRTALVRAHWYTGDKKAAEDLLRATAAKWQEDEKWQEAAVARAGARRAGRASRRVTTPTWRRHGAVSVSSTPRSKRPVPPSSCGRAPSNSSGRRRSVPSTGCSAAFPIAATSSPGGTPRSRRPGWMRP